MKVFASLAFATLVQRSSGTAPCVRYGTVCKAGGSCAEACVEYGVLEPKVPVYGRGHFSTEPGGFPVYGRGHFSTRPGYGYGHSGVAVQSQSEPHSHSVPTRVPDSAPRSPGKAMMGSKGYYDDYYLDDYYMTDFAPAHGFGGHSHDHASTHSHQGGEHNHGPALGHSHEPVGYTSYPIPEPRSGKMGSGKMGSGKMGSGKMGSGKMGYGKMGSGKMSSGKMGSGKMGSGKMGSGKMGSGKMGGSKGYDVDDYYVPAESACVRYGTVCKSTGSCTQACVEYGTTHSHSLTSHSHSQSPHSHYPAHVPTPRPVGKAMMGSKGYYFADDYYYGSGKAMMGSRSSKGR